MKFKKVSSRPNFPELEKKILEYWEKNKIFEKSLKKPSPKGDFVFYEGPPTANGKPGVHHVEARAFKDLFPRYKTMQGYRVERKAGWDTHGLPVELEVEKSLGFSGKRDIEKYGIEKFNKKCAASVWKYKEEWEKLTKRMGYWIDLEHPYITCSNKYIESVWFILKKIWEKGFLYQGHKVVPYCPRCGTALSSHEVAQGYKKVKEESVYVKFPLVVARKDAEPKRGGLTKQSHYTEEFVNDEIASSTLGRLGSPRNDVYFLAWTTTPWTLPGNVALALGGEIDYALIEVLEGKGKIDNCRGLIYQTRGRDKSRPYKEYLILAKDRLKVIKGKYKIVQEFKGKNLAGIEYEPLYPVFSGLSVSGRDKSRPYSRPYRTFGLTSNDSPCYQTVLADFVTTDEGTGIVHTAVMYGEDDYELGKKLGLPKVHTVNLQGKFKFPPLTKGRIKEGSCGIDPLHLPLGKGESSILKRIEGKFVKDAEKDIIEDLRKRNLLYKSELFEHDYPFCWRCKTPLLYYAKKSWFIAMSKLREKLVANNKKINWIPKYLKTGRFGKWIAEAKDWAVSRERYWGTPLPIWQCRGVKSQIQNSNFQINYKSKVQNSKGCGEIKVIGSREELGRGLIYQTRGRDKSRPYKDLHRPYVDEITFKCEKCGGEMRRVPEVLDCWFDSGAMPFAQNHWPFADTQNYSLTEGKDPLQLPLAKGESIPPKLFPADFICEAVDQTRGWFYTLLAISTLLDFGAPYKNVISLGHVLDKNGQKMSKSRGNIVDPFKALDEFSADSIRWFFYTVNRPQESKNFDPAILRDIVSRFILTLWNSYSFFLTYASIDQPKLSNVFASGAQKGGAKQSLRNEIASSLAGRLAPRNDIAGNILDRWILSRLAELNNNIVQYLNYYDVLRAAKEIEQFVDDLSNWYIRRSRRRFWKNENDVDKQEGYETLHFVLVLLCEMLAPFMPFITENIYRNLTGKESVHLAKFPKISSPSFVRISNKGIDQKILEQMDITRRIVTLGLNLRAQAKIKVRQPLDKLKVKSEKLKVATQNSKLLNLMKEELNVKEIKVVSEIKEGDDLLVAEDGDLKVTLNIKITPELKREGIIRDLVRAVQEMRKKAGLEVSDRIELSLYSEDKEIQKAIQEWQDYIQKETLAERIQILLLSGSPTEKSGARVEIEGKEVWISIRNCSNCSN